MKRLKFILLFITLVVLISTLLNGCNNIPDIDGCGTIANVNNINDLKIMFGEDKLYPKQSTPTNIKIEYEHGDTIHKFIDAYKKSKTPEYIELLKSAEWIDTCNGFDIKVNIYKDTLLEEKIITTQKKLTIKDVEVYYSDKNDIIYDFNYGKDLYSISIIIPQGFNNIINKSPLNIAVQTYIELLLS